MDTRRSESEAAVAVTTDSAADPAEALACRSRASGLTRDFIGKAIENGAAAVMTIKKTRNIRCQRCTLRTPRERCSTSRAATARCAAARSLA